MQLVRRLYSAASRVRRTLAPRRTDALTEVSLSRDLLGAQRFVAVDVGAANGLLPHWQHLPHVGTVYQIEPREDACRELERLNAAAGYPGLCRIVAAGLSRDGGERTLYVSNAPTGSSLLPIDPAGAADSADYVDLRYLYPIAPMPVQTLSLDALMDRHAEPNIDLVKLDIQGAELEVLEGLRPTRASALMAVEVELGLHDLYPKEAAFGAAHAFLQSNGFELFDVRVARVHLPRDGDHEHFQTRVFSTYANSPSVSARIWEFDALYFRRRSALLEAADAAALRRMMVVYCTYNFFSEAFDLVEKGRARAYFTDDEARELCQAIVDLHYVKHYRPWLADTPLMRFLRRKMYAVAPRSAPRWCQYMYQNYPNG